ncbi:MAG: VOC family protein [Verrucomicrobiales bacterium]|nr:VOC family protein [Verrucomicrobiales bacterium]
MKLNLEKHLHCISTQLIVANIERTIQFYTKSLGFKLNFRHEDFYAGLGAGPYSIHLKHGDNIRTLPEETDDVDIVIGVTDLDSCYEAVQFERVKIVQELRETPYGREFYVEDPDGYKLAFFDVTA